MPSKIRNPNLSFIEITRLYISWNPPEQPNGKIRKYILKLQVCNSRFTAVQFTYFLILQYIKSKLCDTENITRAISTYETSRTSYTIDTLKPFSKYALLIYAVNTLDGEIETIEIKTPEKRKETFYLNISTIMKYLYTCVYFSYY